MYSMKTELQIIIKTELNNFVGKWISSFAEAIKRRVKSVKSRTEIQTNEPISNSKKFIKDVIFFCTNPNKLPDIQDIHNARIAMNYFLGSLDASTLAKDPVSVMQAVDGVFGMTETNRRIIYNNLTTLQAMYKSQLLLNLEPMPQVYNLFLYPRVENILSNSNMIASEMSGNKASDFENKYRTTEGMRDFVNARFVALYNISKSNHSS